MALALILVAAITAVVILIIGFSKYGLDFIKHGFNQIIYSVAFEKRFDDLEAKMATKEDLAILKTELRTEFKSDIDGLRTEFKSDIYSLRGEINGLRGEMDGLRGEMDGLRGEMDGLRFEMGGFKTELAAIKVNHFGHLKNFLTELTSILVDKEVINNQDKARLDNQLRGM